MPDVTGEQNGKASWRGDSGKLGGRLHKPCFITKKEKKWKEVHPSLDSFCHLDNKPVITPHMRLSTRNLIRGELVPMKTFHLLPQEFCRFLCAQQGNKHFLHMEEQAHPGDLHLRSESKSCFLGQDQ